MKHVPTIVLSFLTILSTAVLGESTFDRELKQISVQREKALAAAAEPINRNYRTSLEQLLRKATQAGDLDSALRIKQAISSIPKTSQLLKAKPTTPDELRDFLVGTVWGISDNTPDAPQQWTMTFKKDGTFKDSRSGASHPWAVEAANRIKLFNYDPATFDADCTLFTAQGAKIKYFGHLIR